MKYDVLEKQYLLKEKEMFETNFYFVLSGVVTSISINLIYIY